MYHRIQKLIQVRAVNNLENVHSNNTKDIYITLLEPLVDK